MTTLSAATWLYPQFDFPEDPELQELPNLFNLDWIWRVYCQQVGTPETDPHQIRIRQFSHSLSRNATVSYDVEWPPDQYIPSRHFVARLEPDQPVEIFQFPDDPNLPGLSDAAQPETALRLINRHVLAFGARRVRVQAIRYRPGLRAVLRHSVSGMRFFVRVMSPAAVDPWLATWEVVAGSDFVAPRLAGRWSEGGVVWMSEIPGKNLRPFIRAGKRPDPAMLLDGLESIWQGTRSPDNLRPFNLRGAYQRAKRSFQHNLRDNDAAAGYLKDAVKALDPFTGSWQPSCVAHNDFYDDQMLVLPDGRIALVDHEEAGPGDPMLDVGNFLAHLLWSSRFARQREAKACTDYYAIFRQAALERFRWDERELDLRVAVCLFRVCTNTIRHPQADWRDKLEAGLALVNESLG